MNDFQRAGGNTATAEPTTAPEPEILTGEIVSESKLTEIQEARTADLDPFIEAARSITIENAEDAEGATEVLAEIQRRKKRLETERVALAAPINEAKNRVQNLFNKLKAPLDDARAILEPKVIAWQDAEDRRIREENAQREREARKKQAAEQARIDAEREAAAKEAKEAAEKARQATEALAAEANADSAAAEAEALAAADAARQAAEVLAAKREERPAFELAEREEAQATVQTAKGSATRKKRWVAEVTNELIVPREYLVVDQVKLNAAVKAGVREIAGVNIHQKSELSVKG